VSREQPARAVEGASPAGARSEKECEELFSGERRRTRPREALAGALLDRQVADSERLEAHRIIGAMGSSPVRALLLVVGILFVAAAVAWPVVSRYFGRLPGDILIRRPGFTFVFPLVTCLLLSLLLSLLFWIFRR
jgi:hypothetical protein